MKAFLTKDTVAQMAALSAHTNDLTSLTADERAQLKEWLQNGMDAGLLAEYRAWAVTVLLYNEGLSENLWTQIKWMDDFKSEIGEPTHPWPKLMQYLNRRGLTPSHPLLEWPLVKAALAEKRAALVMQPPPMYEFDSLF